MGVAAEVAARQRAVGEGAEHRRARVLCAVPCNAQHRAHIRAFLPWSGASAFCLSPLSQNCMLAPSLTQRKVRCTSSTRPAASAALNLACAKRAGRPAWLALADAAGRELHVAVSAVSDLHLLVCLHSRPTPPELHLPWGNCCALFSRTRTRFGSSCWSSASGSSATAALSTFATSEPTTMASRSRVSRVLHAGCQQS